MCNHAPDRNVEADPVEARWREAARDRPDDPDAWRGLGVALLLRASTSRAPDADANATPSAGAAEENEARAVAREAARCLRRAVQLRPSGAGARHALGLALLRAEDDDVSGAAEQLERACALRPGDPRLRSDLARALGKGGGLAAAAGAYRAAIAALQGGVGERKGVESGSSAPAAPPPAPPLHYRLAMTLRAMMASPRHCRTQSRRRELAREARACLARQLALTPGHALSAFWLAALAPEAGADDKDDGDGDEAAAAALAAAAAAASKQGCPPAMVAALFDKYAPSFDRHLVDELEYATPRRLAAALSAAAAAAANEGGGGGGGTASRGYFRRVADFGVGTGLMGPLLRPMMVAAAAGAGEAPFLCGVDLSARMVALARERGCYDALDVGELVGWLRRQRRAVEGVAGGAGDDGNDNGENAAARAVAPFDALIAADVLVYLGGLAPVMEAAAACAAPGSLFALSTECEDDDDEHDEERDGRARDQGGGGGGFRLRATGRFAHRASYVEACANEAGWALASLERRSPLRMNAGQQVWGNLFVLRKLQHSDDARN